jgi:hypothetical protein
MRWDDDVVATFKRNCRKNVYDTDYPIYLLDQAEQTDDLQFFIMNETNLGKKTSASSSHISSALAIATSVGISSRSASAVRHRRYCFTKTSGRAPGDTSKPAVS